MRICRLAFLIGVALFAQQTNDTIRVSVSLVQIDAVVTDATGRSVPDLQKEDFELAQDGRPQVITHFSYIAPRAAGPAPIAPGTGIAPPSAPRVSIRDGRRVVAFVADDLGLSFVSTAHVRDALRTFVDQQMLPNDFVAVFRTGGGGALNQFTNDKRMLHAAIDRIQWSMMSRAGTEPVPAFGPADVIDPGKQIASTLGTFRALRFILDGLRKMPGRKTMVLFSDGIRLPQPMREKPADSLTRPAIERAADQASRASVAIHSVDARGLRTLSLEARDDVSSLHPDELVESLGDRRDKFHESRDGLYALAALTGGTLQADNNDLSASLKNALKDAGGYYLIGFQPGEAAFRKMKGEGLYHRLSLQVKRPGLRVRYHKGYIGTEDRPSPEPRGSFAETVAALESPFAETGVRLRLTPMFAAAGTASVVNVLVHIDARDLTFEPGPDGSLTATIQLVAATWGDERIPADSTQANYTIRTNPQGLERMRSEGLIYNLHHTVKKAGAYHLRVAVRDAGSKRVGSAGQFIDVPDLAKGKLALSGIMLTAGDLRSHITADADASRQGDAVTQGLLKDSALRVFRPNSPISYLLTVFNTPLDRRTGNADLEIRARLFREGKEVWTAKPFPAIVPKGFDPRRVPVGGVVTLGQRTAPGEYFLQVTAVRPGQQGPKAVAAVAWIDFELK